MGEYENHSDQTLRPWGIGAGGRGFLLRSTRGVPELLLWEADEEGRPFHADAEDLLDLDPDSVLAYLVIQPVTSLGLV